VDWRFLRRRRGPELTLKVLDQPPELTITDVRPSIVGASWSIDSAELARYLDASLDANGYRFRAETGDANHQLLEKLRLVHRERRFDIAPELRRARLPASNT
jgi:hypothetical protein